MRTKIECTLHISKSSLGGFQDFNTPCAYHPKNFVEDLADHREPEEFLKTAPPIRCKKEYLPDWPLFFRDLICPEIPCVLVPFDLAISRGEQAFWIEFLLEQYQLHKGCDELSAAINNYLISLYRLEEATLEEDFQTVWDSLIDFIDNPSAKAAKKNPILAALPDIVRRTKASERYRQISKAQETIEEQGPLLILQHSEPLKETDGLPFFEKGETLECWVRMYGSAEMNYMNDMQIWLYDTIFVARKGDKAKPIALMEGAYIVPFKKDRLVDPESFYYWMDSDSELFETIWRIISTEYLPQKEVGSITEFAEKNQDKSGFAISFLEMHPDYRGQKTTPVLLQMFARTINSYPQQGEVGAQNDTGRPHIGEPKLFIFPVHGTKPLQTEEDGSEFSIIRTVRRRNKHYYEFNTEIKRLKLAKYFRSIKEKLGEDIIVFDPYTY